MIEQSFCRSPCTPAPANVPQRGDYLFGWTHQVQHHWMWLPPPASADLFLDPCLSADVMHRYSVVCSIIGR